MPIHTFFRQLSLSRKITYSAVALLSSALLLLGAILYMQWSAATQQQIDALGDTLMRQTAREALMLLASEDTLGLSILLRELASNPYVAHAVIYSPDNSIIAQAGQATRSSENLFSQPLVFQRVLAGTLELKLDASQLQQPMYKTLQSMALFGALFIAAVAFLFSRLGNSIQLSLYALLSWLKSPLTTAPSIERQDVIGQLAQALDAMLAPPLLENRVQPESTPEAPHHLDVMPLPEGSFDTYAPKEPRKSHAKHGIVLAVQLSVNTRNEKLDSQRLTQLFDRYYHALAEAAALYHAQLLELEDGRCLLLFDDIDEHYVRYALCCGELLRAFGHSLQVDLADSDAIVSLQLGMSHGPAILEQTALSEITQTPSVQTALELSGHSRNLLLINSEFASDARAQSCARIRAITRPENAHCVERLLEPYPAQLDKQLHLLTLAT